MAHSHTAIGGSATPNHELFELVRLLSVSSRSPPIDADELLLSEDGGDLTSTATSSATSSASGGGGGGGSSTSSSASQQTGSATTSSSSSNQPPPKRSFFRSIGLGKKSPPLPSKEQHAGDRGGSSSHHDSSSSNARGDGALSSGPSTGGSGAAAAASDPRTAAQAAPCTIVSTASAGTPSYYFIALFVSTSYFVFRYDGAEDAPLVKYLRWFSESNKQVVSMAFDDEARWLMCLTLDQTVALIPLYYLLRPTQTRSSSVPLNAPSALGVLRGSSSSSSSSDTLSGLGIPPNSPPQYSSAPNSGTSTPQTTSLSSYGSALGPIDDVTIISLAVKQKGVRGAHCIWWKTWDEPCQYYGIIITSKGQIRFINLLTMQEEKTTFTLEEEIQSVQLEVNEGADRSKYLILLGTINGYVRLKLEQEVDRNRFVNLFQSPSPPTQTRFNLSHRSPQMSLQRTKQGTLLGVHYQAHNKFEVFFMESGSFPLFLYQLPPGSELVQLTDHLLFTVINEGDAADGPRIAVVSKLIAAGASVMVHLSGPQPSSIVQMFHLPSHERIRGCFRVPPFLGTQLEGLLVWTTESVYEIKQFLPPETIFFQQLADDSADSLGKTVGLDILSLYEQAADHFYSARDYPKSLELYSLSNVEADKLVHRFLSICPNEIISYLRTILKEPDSLSNMKRKRYADVLFNCYLHRILLMKHSPNQFQVEEFNSFIEDNKDYTASSALYQTIESQMIPQFFKIAHTRDLLEAALEILVTRGAYHLSEATLEFFTSVGCVDFLKRLPSGRILLSAFSPDKQVRLYLHDDGSGAWEYTARIAQLLPFIVEERVLLEVAACFDPLGQNMIMLQKSNFQRSGSKMQLDRRSTLESQANVPSTQQLLANCLELFVLALLCLSYRRRLLNYQKQQRREQRLKQLKTSNSPARTSVVTDEQQEATTANNDKSERSTGAATALAVPSPSPSKPKTPTPALPPQALFESLQEQRVVTVRCGSNHTCAITDTGEVFAWGKGDSGQLGLGGTPARVSTPTRIEALAGRFCIAIACGGEHTLAITRTGELFAWGSNGCGQLGLADSSSRSEPTLVTLGNALMKDELPVQIACGFYHSVAVTNQGRVFTTGSGAQGELGHGNERPVRYFAPIKTIDDAVEVACGHAHTALRTENGDVYTWGNGYYGQLGHGTLQNELSPRLVQALRGKRIRKIACGAFHTLAITDLSNIYSWGRGNSFRLGHGDKQDQPAPKLVETLIGKKVADVAAGSWHTVAVTLDSGVVYAWGGCSKGQLGLGETRERDFPTVVRSLQSESIVGVQCGEEFTIVISESGSLFAFGVGESGQLGLGDEVTQLAPKPVKLHQKLSYRVLGKSAEGGERRRGRSASGKTHHHLTAEASASGTIPRRTSLEPSDVPSPPHSGSGVYDQRLLESSLREQARNYRPSVVIRYCHDWQNYAAASIVYEEMKDWEEALECRIRDIQMNSALGEQPENSTARDAKLQEELLEWLEYYVSNALSLNAGAAAPGTGSTAATSSPAPSVAAPTSIPSTPPSTLTRASSSSATASPPLHGRGAITNTNDTEQRRVGALLYQVLEQWAIHQLDVEVFEQYLLNQLHKFGAALVWLLEEHYREQQARVADAQIMASVPAISSSSSSSSSSSNLLEGSVSESDELPMPWVLPFSSQLYIAAASFGLEQARLMQPASTINTDNLKASIMENLSKDLAKRDVVVLDGLSFSGAASSSSSSSSSSYSFAAKGSTTVDDPMGHDALVFSCNHHFPRRRFFDTVLPKFETLVRSFPVPIPSTIALIVDDYHHKLISQVCPVCLYRTLKREQETLAKGLDKKVVQLQSWEL